MDEKHKALIKIWDHMMKGARRYVEDNGFIAIHGQPLIGTIVVACESVSNLFPIDFYGKKRWMSQSNQILIEKYSQEFGKIYCEITSFRQEPEADNRRLGSFNLLELEHQGSLDELLNNIEGVIYSIVEQVTENCQEELKLFGRNPDDLKLKIGKISYTDAVKLLNNNGFPELEWGTDIDAKHEKKLCELVGPVFCHRYPGEIKFWNMKDDPENTSVVLSADLLMPGVGECAGSAQRETSHSELLRKLESSEMFKVLLNQGVQRGDFDHYLNYHLENDVVDHSGCGIGLNRIVQWLIGSDDIREATPFVINRDTLG